MSDSTSQKHRNFIQEPIKDKLVTSLAGVGEVYGKRFEEKGYDKAYVVLGQFLLLRKDEEMFVDWLNDTVQMDNRRAKQCFDCLNEWCNNYL